MAYHVMPPYESKSDEHRLSSSTGFYKPTYDMWIYLKGFK